MISRFGINTVVALLAAAALAAEPEVEPKQLPRIPPTEPANALSTFRIKSGFRVELVAAEPLVIDPVAMSFDEDGRLYVVEMRDYSERRPERLGRIRLLEDTDGDGRFDKSTVFAQNLPWPTAVTCWAGGVFVGATPDIIYFKDTNGDGVADVRETIFTGFAADYAPFATNKLNVQGLMNSFQWSLDNRIQGATSSAGGRVTLVDSPFVRQWLERAGSHFSSITSPLELRGRDFSFDSRTLEMRAESGGGQHGMSFDNRGRKFVCSNSDHIQLIMYEDRYAARNPYFAMPSPRVSIAVDGPAAEVFRISPDEPWRVIRTQWRVNRLVPGPIEGGGRPSGYFTGATGVTIYRGDAFPEEMVGDAFVGDCGSNLVHRKKLRPDGLLLRAERPADEQKVEFLASTDNWFRPVQFANAPDGGLYIADMYREVIEHPWSLPANLKKHLDLNSGNDRGRIYRIVPEKSKPRPLPRLSKASVPELVKMLESPNGWHRDTAARLLYERQDKAAIVMLVNLFISSKSRLARLHALHALNGISGIKEITVLTALDDLDEVVRAEGVRFSEQFLAAPSDKLWQKLKTLSVWEPFSRYQLAFALGETRAPERIDLLAQLSEPRGRAESALWIQAAVLNSLHEGGGGLFARLYGTKSRFSYESGMEFLLQLVRMIGTRGQQEEINPVMDFVLGNTWQRSGDAFEKGYVANLDIAVISALNDGVQSAGRRLNQIIDPAKLQPILARAQRLAQNPRTAITNRVQFIPILGLAGYSESAALLLPFLESSQPSAVQAATLKALDRFAEPEVAAELIRRWASFTPTMRRESLVVLLKRPERIRALLTAIEQGTVRPADLTVEQQAQLRSQKDPTLRDLAKKVLGRPPEASRQSVVDSFAPALNLNGVAANGRKVFQSRCVSCHRLGSEGYALGPDLVTVRNGGKEKLLSNILDPNREVAPNYLSYLVETKDGESLTGIIGNESARSVMLRQANGAETVVLRSNIASMQSQEKSLMPEGLEAGLSQQEMADLLEFIMAP